MVQLQIKEIEKKKVKKILDKLKLKMGKHYDFGAGKGSTFVLELDTVGSKIKIHTHRGQIEIKGHKQLSQFVNILRKNFRIV